MPQNNQFNTFIFTYTNGIIYLYMECEAPIEGMFRDKRRGRVVSKCFTRQIHPPNAHKGIVVVPAAGKQLVLCEFSVIYP